MDPTPSASFPWENPTADERYACFQSGVLQLHGRRWQGFEARYGRPGGEHATGHVD
ncbi:hypothetical protein MCOR25_011248, partial [Pyricularia grisea]